MTVKSHLHIRRGLSAAEAAIYIGIGLTKFSQLVALGVMPKPRMIGSRRVWCVTDLDAAFDDLPMEDGQEIDSWAAWRGRNKSKAC